MPREGDEWLFHRPLRLGAKVQAALTVAEVSTKESGWGSIHQFEDTVSRDDNGKEIARVRRL